MGRCVGVIVGTEVGGSVLPSVAPVPTVAVPGAPVMPESAFCGVGVTSLCSMGAAEASRRGLGVYALGQALNVVGGVLKVFPPLRQVFDSS